MSAEVTRMQKDDKYIIQDPKLAKARSRTRELLRIINNASSGEKEKIRETFRAMLGSIGDGEWIERPFYIDYGNNVSLGKSVYFNFNCVILGASAVTIGDLVLFAPAIQLQADTQPVHSSERKREPNSDGNSIEIESDVWVGGRAIIGPGVKIGQCSVIGAGSVVVEDVPPNSLAVGNPARVIRKLTDEKEPNLVRSDSGSEKDRMLKGELYYPLDPQLTAGRARGRSLMEAFNNINEEETDKRREIMQNLFGQIGEHTVVETPFFCDYGSLITLGNNVRIKRSCIIVDVCSVTIGDNAIIGNSVHFYSGTHPLNASTRHSGLEYGRPINVGSDVCIGDAVILCPGVSIGDGTVIGPGSIVTKDIPSNVFAAGSPCRVLEDLKTNE